LPWTESRSREEWLAEVQRRGIRIRRRRRIGMGVVGAFALVLPVSVTAAALRSGPENAVEVSVAGPAPAGGLSTTTSMISAVSDGGLAAATPAEAPPPVGAPSTTTTTEVHQRVAATTTTVVEPAPRQSPVSGTDPAGSPSTTLAPVENQPAADTPTDVPPEKKVPVVMTLRPCATSEVKVTVTTDKAVYARGEPIMGSWTLEKASEADCRLEGVDEHGVYTRMAAQYETPTGRWIGAARSLSTTSSPEVAPAPQKEYSFLGISWDQKDCTIAILGVDPSSATECPLAQPGTYYLAFEWNGPEYPGDPVGSPHFTGRATFRISA
jgi:hypothetical protein